MVQINRYIPSDPQSLQELAQHTRMSQSQLSGLVQWAQHYGQTPEELAQNPYYVQGFMPVDASAPSPLLPVSDVLSIFALDVTKKFTLASAGDSDTETPNFSMPGAIYAASAGARTTSGTALSAGAELNSFSFQIQRVGQTGPDPITESVLASSVLGTGAWPRYFGGNAIMIPGAGNSVKYTVIGHVANLEVSIALRCLLVVGPSNYQVG